MAFAAIAAALAEPSRATLKQLCFELDRMTDEALTTELPRVLAGLERWPDELRVVMLARHDCDWAQGRQSMEEQENGPIARWLWELFDGVLNPRLAVLREASLVHELEYDRGRRDPFESKRWGKQSYESLVLAMVRHLDPGFSYPPVLLRKEEERTPGYEKIFETFGDAKTGLVHTDYTIEHAADYTYGDHYAPYGLADGSRVELDRADRSGSGAYKLDMFGRAPAVLELALAWSEIVRSGPAILDVESIAEIAARLR